jgi:hypothetical protein
MSSNLADVLHGESGGLSVPHELQALEPNPMRRA